MTLQNRFSMMVVVAEVLKLDTAAPQPVRESHIAFFKVRLALNSNEKCADIWLPDHPA